MVNAEHGQRKTPVAIVAPKKDSDEKSDDGITSVRGNFTKGNQQG